MLSAGIEGLLAALVGAGWWYYLLVLIAARPRSRPPWERRGRTGRTVSFSVLKPLAGDEPGLARNLASFYEIDYPRYDIGYASADPGDPGLATATRLAREREDTVRSTALFMEEPRWPNPKAWSLNALTDASDGEFLVVSDSDIRTGPGLLKQLARDFRPRQVGVVTCPYRAVPGDSVWSLLEALGMNTTFWSGVLASRFLVPMDFAVGPTMAIRRSCLQEIGGWRAVKDFLAEDFQIGRLARKAGYKVLLSEFVVEHRIGSQGFAENMAHRLRWQRSTRRSRPVGYFGEVFTHGLPFALMLALVAPGVATWSMLAVSAGLRYAVAITVSRRVLRDTLVLRYWWLVPVQDLLGLACWLAGFFGNTIKWRGREYRLEKDGRLRKKSD